MRIRPEPQLHVVAAELRRDLVGRHQRAPGGALRNAGGARCPSRARSADHSPSAPISAMPCSSAVAAPRRQADADAVGVHDEVLDPRAELEHDVGAGARPPRAAPPAGRRDGSPSRARRSACSAAAPSGMRASSRPLAVLIATAAGRDMRPQQPLAEPERDQDARGVGRELDAGAGLLQPLGLFEHGDAEAARASASAAVSPPIPAPATMTVREGATACAPGRSGRLGQRAVRRPRRVRIERRIVAVERRAIGADDLVVVAHVEEDVRMIERRLGARRT